MWVDQEIWDNSFLGEWHILLLVGHSNRTFLTMPRSEFVTNLWESDRPHLHFREGMALFVDCDNDRVNLAILRMLELGRDVLLVLERRFPNVHAATHDIAIWILGRLQSCSLSNDDIISTYSRSRLDDTVFVKLVISTLPSSQSPSGIWVLKCFIFTTDGIVIGPVESRSEDASVNAGLVTDDGVLLVVASVASNADNCIAACRKLFEVKEIHRLSTDQRLLGIVENMGKRVHPEEVVAGVDTHCLLTHCALISVTRRLIVVWEGNDRCADT